MVRRQRKQASYMISAVAEAYGIHPQTLRLYEREGLLKPSRTDGNTRFYTEEDLHRLEMILNLTRDLGVNLAGVEIVLKMRERMEQMQRHMGAFVEMVQNEMATMQVPSTEMKNAMVRVMPRANHPQEPKKK